jgi:hypothetical protein
MDIGSTFSRSLAFLYFLPLNDTLCNGPIGRTGPFSNQYYPVCAASISVSFFNSSTVLKEWSTILSRSVPLGTVG